MNKKIGLLSALLLIQMVLVAIALVIPLGDDETPPQLLSFDVDKVDRLIIGDGSLQVEVSRAQGAWQVAGVRADEAKINELLGKLASIDAPWPVATSSTSAERFEVSESNHQRHVRLYAGDAVAAELYLGTSPGYQRVHARRADSDEVFSVPLSNYELGVEADGWVDKTLLQMAGSPTRIEVTRVEEAGNSVATLTSTDEGWLYNGAAADQDAASTYANRFTTLRVLGLADTAVEAEASPSERGRIVLSNADEQLTLLISSSGDEDDYLVTAQGSDHSFRLATYVAEQLLMADVDFAVRDGELDAPVAEP